METTAGKRSAESEQSVDTFAFCTRCARLSGNLHTCEKCGSALSADSAAVCCSAEPKRARTERSTATNGSAATTVNGTSSLSSSTTVTSNKSSRATSGNKTMDSSGGGDSAPVPVPQALYVNKNAAAAHLPAGSNFVGNAMSLLPTGQGDTSAVAAQPQTLYMNMNGQNGTGNQSLSQAAGSVAYGQTQPPPLSHPPLPTSQADNFTGPHVGMVTSVVATSRPTASNSSLNNINALGLASAAGAVSRVSPIQGTHQSHVQAGIGAAANTMMPSASLAFNTTVSTAGSTPAPGFQNVSNASGAMPEEVTYTSNVLQFPAVQIRVGARKFKPSTLIMVKDDGVLFTLKDYPNAPVLLNARAIVRCKMCLTANHFPVMFLQLEKSCMRQIRTIFQIHDDDFMEINSNFMKTCITIFPCFPIHQSHIFVNGLRESFTSMRIKYDRQKLLEEVSVDEVIDIMLAAINTTSRAMTGAGRGNTVRVAPGSTHTTVRQTVPGGNASDILRSVAQTAQQPIPPRSQPPPYSRAVQQIRPQSVSTNSSAQPTVGRNSMSGAPLLVVPNDAAKWQAMQKNLVVGGVYHVQMANGEKRYSLWNGNRLVPCLVQSSEVHMDCAGVRVGYLRANVVGKVRIKADQQAGIHFNLFSQSCGTQSIFIPQEEATCFVCFEKYSVLFIYPTWAAATKLRAQCRLNQSGPMSYDPYSKDEQARNIILFLKDVNPDQQDALKQMKQASSPSKPMLEDIGLLAALKRLLPLRPQLSARKNDFLVGNNLNKFETLVEELLNPEKMAQLQRDADADDDDDVIMTQEEVGIKCPYTQSVMKVPIRNKICGHNYEKQAIQEFILRKKGNAKCPYAGCGNSTPLKSEDLEENLDLKKYIEQNHKGS